MTDGAALTGPYLAMHVAATFIAGFGLMENSPAVIIGAMLIAMVYGPILGIAMALAQADLRLLGLALVAEVVGAICVLAIGRVIGLSTRHLVVGSEILNRTPPNLLTCCSHWSVVSPADSHFSRSQEGSLIFSLDKVFLPPRRYCRHPSIRTLR